ncbi:MAG: hypothetical protein LBU06_09390, partial [Desulfovibrio sp.]|nr:hypothetical protein [Desulfovibrio sp.]
MAVKSAGVAVVCDDHGKPAPFSGECDIDVYRRGRGAKRAWKCVTHVRFSPGPDQSGEGVRRAVERLVRDLEDVRVLVASGAGGVAYAVLRRAGFAVFEMAEFFPDCLDELMREIEEPCVGEDVPESPAETAPGFYVFDLAAALAAHPDLSSKMMLRPFFDKARFCKLELRCGHVPP